MTPALRSSPDILAGLYTEGGGSELSGLAQRCTSDEELLGEIIALALARQ